MQLSERRKLNPFIRTTFVSFPRTTLDTRDDGTYLILLCHTLMNV